jgi:hypothetical protein
LLSGCLVAPRQVFFIFKEDDHNLFAEIAIQKMKKASATLKNKDNPEIIYVGSSHGQFGFAPEIMQREIGIRSFNLAYGGGSNVGLQVSLLKKLLEGDAHKPKVIVYAMDVFTLNASPSGHDNFQKLFFNEKQSLLSFFDKQLYSCFKLYANNIPVYFKQVMKGNMKPLFLNQNYYNLSMFARYDSFKVSPTGWVEAYGILNKNYLRYSDMVFNPDPKAVLLLNEYIDICRQNNIELLFVQVPEHKSSLAYSKKYKDFNSWIDNFVKQNKVPFLDYNKEEKFPVAQDSLFFDTDHLNAEGAKLFSQLFSVDFKMFLANRSINLKPS